MSVRITTHRQLEISYYSLTPVQSLNARTEIVKREGALLRISQGSIYGVADIFPWPELGDLKLPDEIRLQGPLYQQALKWAEYDLQARLDKKSLLVDRWVSCYQTYSAQDFDLNMSVEQKRKRDLEINQQEVIKVKLGKDYSNFIQFLNEYQGPLKFRLDFNSSLTFIEFENFLSQLNSKKNIEYIEDPIPFEPAFWQKYNTQIPLAVDFEKATTGFSLRIWKPSRQKDRPNSTYVITSAMDHTVGHIYALLEASRNLNQVCGLLTYDRYNELQDKPVFRKKFSENKWWINFSETALKESEKYYGIGLNSYLDRLVWQSI